MLLFPSLTGLKQVGLTGGLVTTLLSQSSTARAVASLGVSSAYSTVLLVQAGQATPGWAEARRGAELGLAPRASDRKERLGASGLTRTVCPAAPRRRRSGARPGAALQHVHLSEQVMA